MNRAERRREERNKQKTPSVNLRAEEIKRIKDEATREAIAVAFKLMMTIPASVIHEKYPLLMRREVNGQNRVERFVELCIDRFDSFDRGYVSIEDLEKELYDEAGVEIK